MPAQENTVPLERAGAREPAGAGVRVTAPRAAVRAHTVLLARGMNLEFVSPRVSLLCAAALAVLLAAACGASRPSSNADVAAMPSDQRPEGTGGNAAEGARCDFGGAGDFTCRGGLSCCYGADYQTTGYGSCRAECEEN